MALINFINFILDLAALLLWINWRIHPGNSMRLSPPATLTGTVRRAELPPLRRWHFAAALGLLLGLRAVIYHLVGSAVQWTGVVELPVVSTAFRSDLFSRMLLFSLLSFAVTLVTFLVWLLLLSALKPTTPEPAPFQHFIRAQLGTVDEWSGWVKIILPFIGAATMWWLVTWLLEFAGITPPPAKESHRLTQALLVGLGSYLTWKYLVALILMLHLANSYVYFGDQALWRYVNVLGKTILRPLRKIPLQVARVDFAPIVGLILLFVAVHYGEKGLHHVSGLKPSTHPETPLHLP